MSENEGKGLGLAGSTFLVLLTLKATGLIAWSWWVVFAPLYVGLLAWAVIFAVSLTAIMLTDGREK